MLAESGSAECFWRRVRYSPVMLSLGSLLTIFSTFLAPAAAVAPPPPAVAAKLDAAQTKALVAKVQQFYDSTKDLRAHFDQQIESSIGAVKKASGDMLLKKGGKMRWDYTKPEKKLMVADGTTLWVHEPEDQQAFKQELRGSTMPLSVAVLIGEAKLAAEFDIVPAEKITVADGEAALQLSPKAPSSAYHHLVFVVDASTGQVKQTIIFDHQGGKNRMTFSAFELNKGIEDARFKFSPPAGTKIIQPK